ncbi:hypothetical protein [Methylibium petroleiphilum]|uniref:hypothetical protein n=1 Tax=Methylibium petroleiphilum TaxID=105560 RepID=UPI001ACB4A58|nr:hypothetical protein [Methylibium petroleiphilum]MBN9203001.1 hypothetical protein [Methylibium petroleiphilum]
MATYGVTDIDVLALSVRDRESRRLILEAITAYRGGALRSAIMSIWISVVHDVFSKARELAGQGDPAAAAFAKDVDAAIEHKSVPQMQAIERNLLQTARENLQLFTQHEFDVLKRIQDDRNLCAHPAFVTEDELFQPAPDLVRSHIVHALQCLLVHAPLQGKSALSRIRVDILSPSFPATRDSIGTYVAAKYLNRAKDALVTNLVKVLLKALFLPDGQDFFPKRRQLAWTLSEVATSKTAIYEEVARPMVATYFEGVADENLLHLCVYLGAEPRIWTWLSEPVRMRVTRLLEHADVATLKRFMAFDAFAVPDLVDFLLAKFTGLDQDGQIELISDTPRREFVGRAIAIYASAGNYRSAEQYGQSLIVPLASFFTADDVRITLEAVLGNSQISYASGSPDVLMEVFRLTQPMLDQTRPHWQRFVDEMTAQHGGKLDAHYSYPGIRAKLQAA